MAEAGIIRRKVASARVVAAEGGPGADRSWRLGLARAARDQAKLALEVLSLVVERRSLAELAELVPDRAMIAVLDGPAEGLGAIVFSQSILGGFIEAQTIGHIRAQPGPPRRPTRTDAAMVAQVIDAALSGMESALEDEADLVWAGGFRYASFLDEARTLTLLLEDAPLRLIRAEVALAGGLRRGEIILALPAEGRGQRPALSAASALPDHGPVFAQDLAERVNGAAARVEAVLARLTLPLAQVMALTEGMILALPDAALDMISLEGLDGRRVGEGKLGQNRGMRAIRLVEKGAAQGSDAGFGAGSGAGFGGIGAGGDALPTRRPAAGPEPEAADDFPVMDFPAMDLPAMDFPAMAFPAMGADSLSDFLATGTD